MGKIVKIKESDAELLGDAMMDLESAMQALIEIKHPLGETIFHMVHSISFYVEQYLVGESKDIYKLPRPSFKHMEVEGEDK